MNLRQIVSSRSKAMVVLANVDFGHTSPRLTLPMGTQAQLNPQDRVFKVSGNVQRLQKVCELRSSRPSSCCRVQDAGGETDD
ncbi:hypothetical protein [Deinococcus alpinitundrae]|uniref:hypothetical protein n=1 Tax=Deinococcus alpinitundrae TaxID=468913 RepID=UPI00137AC214